MRWSFLKILILLIFVGIICFGANMMLISFLGDSGVIAAFWTDMFIVYLTFYILLKLKKRWKNLELSFCG